MDFLRFYAGGEGGFDNQAMYPSAPWCASTRGDFPLAIFVGQAGRALAAGNTVLASPRSEHPLIAAEAVRTMWAAVFHHNAVQLLPGIGATVGARLVAVGAFRGCCSLVPRRWPRILQRSTAGRRCSTREARHSIDRGNGRPERHDRGFIRACRTGGGGRAGLCF